MKRKKALSLNEVLIVFTIIALFSSIIALGYIRKKRKEEKTFCLMNMKAIHYAIELYENEHSNPDITFKKGMGAFDKKHKDVLAKYLNYNKFPECPSGGTYMIDDFGYLVCSAHKEISILVDAPVDEKQEKEDKISVKNSDLIQMSEDENYFQKAKELLISKKYSEAAFLFKRAYEVNNSKDYYLYYAAKSFYLADQFSDAKDCLEKILKYNKAKELLKEIKIYQFFNSIFNNYTDYKIFYLLKDYSGSDTILSTNLLGKNENPIISEIANSDFFLDIKNKIIYYSNGSSLYSYNIKTKNNVMLYDNKLPIFSLKYRKNKILFLSPKINNKLQLIEYNIKGDYAFSISDNTQNVADAYFSPNGFYIYYLADGGIFKYNVETKLSNRITNKKINVFDFTLNEYKDLIAYSYNEVNSENRFINIIDSDDKIIKSIKNNSTSCYFPNFSPDGEILSYISKANGVENIYIYDFSSDSNIKISDFKNKDMNFYKSAKILPDNSCIYFIYGDSENHSLYLSNIQTKKILKIIDKANDITKLFILYKKLEKKSQKNLDMFH